MQKLTENGVKIFSIFRGDRWLLKWKERWKIPYRCTFPRSGETTSFIHRRGDDRSGCCAHEGVNRTSSTAREHERGVHPFSERGPLKRITRLILDCKIERAERRGTRRERSKWEGDGQAYLSRSIDLCAARFKSSRKRSARAVRPV